VILAVVSAIATTGTISASVISIIILKAVLFLFGSILLGHFSAPYIGKYLSKIHTGIGMKFTLAISFGLIFSAIAGSVGLAPIVGAFAAGLVLDAVHFKGFKEPEVIKEIKEATSDLSEEKSKKINYIIDKYSKKHVEELIEPLGFFFVPIFFIMTGMSVDLKTFVDPNVLLIALGITVTAFIGKIVAGLVAGNCRKILVGWAMVPRGEVGLIFATIGKGLGVIDDRLFSIVVIMVILSTLVTPLVLAKLLQGRTS
jgi:Kef-type K+ transport system membrane component KefB